MRKRIMIRFGELALKGKNRGDFERQLVQNIKDALSDLRETEIQKAYGRLYVLVPTDLSEEAADRLKCIFGISSFSFVEEAKPDLADIQQTALKLVMRKLERGKPGSQPESGAPEGQTLLTYKVETRRVDKSFPLTSMEVSRKVGGFLKAHAPLKVDLYEPDLPIHIEIRQEGAFLFSDAIPAAGGLPVGSSGKVLLMLSGGIDSPVAGWLTMKRGVQLEAVHFHSYPFTSEQSRKKVEDLVQILTRYGGKIRLHVVPFTEIQTEIRKNCPESLGITIMRRMMLRIAEKLAVKYRALAIATGESLGQVASQTLESMLTINQVTRLPVLRPVIAYDKQEIIALAKQIGTYDISILPYEDCCTIFTPKSPKTRPRPEMAERAEQALDVDVLVQRAVAQVESVWFYPGQNKKEFQYF